jgi:hypothetical protein
MNNRGILLHFLALVVVKSNKQVGVNHYSNREVANVLYSKLAMNYIEGEPTITSHTYPREEILSYQNSIMGSNHCTHYSCLHR